jgi:glutamine---fructose-6-phosphate transaminase (isomerizing)
MNSHFLKDINSQPDEWLKCLEYYKKDGKHNLVSASKKIRKAERVIITGIGASYNAGIAIKFLFDKFHHNVHLIETSELLLNPNFLANDVIVFLSRSGKSIELVKAVELSKAQGIYSMAICNDEESPIALMSNLFLDMHVKFDHAISVNTFTAIILVGVQLYLQIENKEMVNFEDDINSTKIWMEELHQKISKSSWLNPNKSHYFLGRGSDISAANAAVLLWEEAVKLPASFKTTGNFRHGAQEIVNENLNILMWLDASLPTFENDHLLINDLRKNGVTVFTISDKAIDENTIVLPTTSKELRLLNSQIPAQFLAYELALRNGVDSDSFRFCSYIVESEGGL